MTREELEKRLESAEKQMIGLQDEIQNLKTKLAEAQDEPEIPDKPDFEIDEKFYYLSSLNGGVEDTCCVDIDDIDFNMFHTEEYAQEFADKCKLIAMMLHCKWYLDRDYVPDWDAMSEIKWDVHFDSKHNKFLCNSWSHSKCPVVYFSSGAKATKCADWLNKHWRDSDE